MTQTAQIANRFREVLLNGTFVAYTNFKAQLSDMNWVQATHKIGNLNTIAALTFHIHYYIAGVLHFFDHSSLDIRDKYSFDMPPITCEEDWQKLLGQLLRDAERFAELVEQMPDEKLDEVFGDPKYGNYRRNIDGMIEHSYYHLGQISLIKKLAMEKEY